MMARRQKDYSILLTQDFSKEQMRHMIPKLAKVANERLKTLEKNGVDIWAYRSAEKYFTRSNREKNRFSAAKNNSKIQREFREIAEFLNYKSSTMAGVQEMKRKHLESIENTIGMKIQDPSVFWDFIKSSEYKSLRKRIGSPQAMLDFAQAMTEKNFSADEIKQSYRDFLASDTMTFEQIAERRKASKGLK